MSILSQQFVISFRRRLIAYSSTALFLVAIPANAGERELYDKICKNASDDSTAECRDFISKYPRSAHAADVRMILAARSRDPYESIRQYEYIGKNSKSSSNRKTAAPALLELYFLTAQYDKLSGGIIDQHDIQKIDKKLIHYFIRARIATFDYDQALDLFEAYANHLTQSANAILSLALFYTSGRHPDLKDAAGMNPSQLFFIAREFYSERKYDYAFSAYKDIRKNYPRSPEAIISRNRYESLDTGKYRYSSRYISEIKDVSFINSLTPEHVDSDEHNDLSYSVLFGPFSSLNEVKSLRKELKPDYDAIMIVRKGAGYYLYAGDEPSIDRANNLKIRLAEEFGLNGKIVQRKEENGREYIYGE